MHDDAPRRGAALARRPHGTEQDGPNREIEIRMGSHDDGIVAAQFEDRSPQPIGHRRGHVATDPNGTRKADEREARIAEHAVPHLMAIPDQKVEQAGLLMVPTDLIGGVLDGDRQKRCRV